MAVITSIQVFGNALGVALNKEFLAEAGFATSDEVRIEATPGRITITRLNGEHAKAMDGFRKAMACYPAAMANLAK